MTKPLILVDPWPRRRAMIFTEAQWRRLEGLARLAACEGDAAMPADEIDALLPDATIIIGQTDLPAARLARAASLRAVINVEGNFFPNIDYESCFARGVAVLSIAPAFAGPVAEMSLALALDLARGVAAGDRAMREGIEKYGFAGNSRARSLIGSTLGLVGFGNLGRAFRRLVAGFHPRLLVHDPWLPANAAREEGCEPVSLEALLAHSDFVFLFAAVTSDNKALIGARELSLMKEDAALILASRAAIVDFDALIEAANSGRIRVAADVFPEEPLPARHPARASAMLLSSHRAGGVPAAFHDIGERVLDDVDLILRGLPPVRLQAARRETVGRLRSRPGRSYSEAEARR